MHWEGKVMDIKNIEEFMEKINKEEAAIAFRKMMNQKVTPAFQKADNQEKALSDRPLDCTTTTKRERKNQERLSMFYAGKKRRKGGSYA
jgi:hypothetical protein